MFSVVEESTHWMVQKCELKVPIPMMKNRLTIHPKYDNISPIQLFIETDTHFGIPRYYQNIAALSNNIVDKRVVGEDISYEMTYPLRPRQKVVFDEFAQAVADGYTGITTVASTGTGKTVLLLNYIQRLGKTALIVVPRTAILDQWVERILEHTNLTKDDIGIAQGPKCQYKGKKIVIGMLHSLAMDKYDEEFKNYFGILAIDELHTLATEHFAVVMGLFPAKYRLGATATFRRKDGTLDAIKYHLCEKVIEDKGGLEASPTIIVHRYKTNGPKHPYLDQITDKIKRVGIINTALAKDIRRTVLIAKYADKFVKNDRRTVVLSSRKDQLKALQNLLISRYGYQPHEVGLFIQETKAAERKRVLANCKIILATYGVMNMAVDVADLRGLIYGTPLSDAEQAVGRITRLNADARTPFVVDIVDEDYEDCERWYQSRQVMYNSKKINATIVEQR